MDAEKRPPNECVLIVITFPYAVLWIFGRKSSLRDFFGNLLKEVPKSSEESMNVLARDRQGEVSRPRANFPNQDLANVSPRKRKLGVPVFIDDHDIS